tara:strand:+ start:15584 stop:15742 length:159 start_codon:yes stop_codon:yes gene_type:complete
VPRLPTFQVQQSYKVKGQQPPSEIGVGMLSLNVMGHMGIKIPHRWLVHDGGC